MRYNSYTVVRASGDVEMVRVPTAWNPFEVASRLKGSLVFLHVPRGHDVYTVQGGYGRKPEERTVLVHNGRLFPVGPAAPTSDAEAHRIYRQIIG
jgi:hypothetical protein